MIRDYGVVLDFVKDLSNTISCTSPVMFHFSKDISVGSANTRVFDSSRYPDNIVLKGDVDSYPKNVVYAGDGIPKYVINVGVRELNPVLEQMFSSYKNVGDFVTSSRNTIYGQMFLSYECAMGSALLSMFHELRHFEQYEMARGADNDFDEAIPDALRSLVVSRYTHQFYLDNYRHMPHEIDAERAGILNAYEFLCEFKNEDFAKDAITQALQWSDRLDIGPIKYHDCNEGFSKEWFSSCVDSAMDEALVSDRNVSSLIGWNANMHDFLANYFSLNEKDTDTFLHLSRGCEQDAYLSRILLLYSSEAYSFFDAALVPCLPGISEPVGGQVYKPVVVPPIDVNAGLKKDTDFELF